MAVVAGGQVLFGKVPDYYVIDWLPIYNFLIGVLSVVDTAVLIWKRHSYALPAAVATLSLHAVVMLILLIGYRDVVATDSLMAMTIRISTWLIILGLLFFAVKRGETVQR
jgi:hypothetical protein